MKSLVLHIEYLLHHHDCLVLPGVGGFMIDYTPATIDFKSGLINPPTRNISFNPQLSHDDGLLVNSIARAEKIKFEEARILLYHQLSELKDSLLLTSKVQLGKLGKLELSENNDILFIPGMTNRQLQSEAGTPSFSIPLDSISYRGGNKNPEQSKEIIAKTSESESDNLPPDTYIRVLSKKNYYIPVNKIFARCAASIIVIAAIALSFVVPQPSGNPQEVKASLNPTESLAARHADAPKIETPIPESISDPEREDIVNSNPTDDSPVYIQTPEGYYLIVGTFPNQDEAEIFMTKRSGGTYPLQVIERNGLYRISAGHGDYQTLRSILNSSEFRAAFSEAWIWNSDKK